MRPTSCCEVIVAEPWTWNRIARRIRVPLGFLFAAFYLWRARPTWETIGAGVVVVCFGLIIRALASGHVKKDRELTTTGPYAYVRNPLYLGSILLGIGFAIDVPVIQGEQNYLLSTFPGYAEYTQQVPSLLPRKLWFTGVTNGFSRELYFRHREYNSLLGAAAIVAVLVAKILLFPG